MSSVANSMGASRCKAWFILLFCAAYVGCQLFVIARAYFVPSKHFAFWMFPETTHFKANLTRVLADGREVITSYGSWAVRSGSQTVEYDWRQFVQGYHMDRFATWERSKGTFDDTLKYFQAALDYIADRIPEDRVTQHLVLRIEYEKAGGTVQKLVLASKPRLGDKRNGGR